VALDTVPGFEMAILDEAWTGGGDRERCWAAWLNILEERKFIKVYVYILSEYI